MRSTGLARSTLPWVAIAWLTTGATGCGSNKEEAAPVAEQHEEAAPGEGQGVEAVRLSQELLEEFDIQVETAGPGWIERSEALPAEVRPNQDRLAHVTPRFPGIVQEVRKQIGDSVRAGEALAVIESSESLAPYVLKTLIDGVVIAKHVTRGEPVSQETECFVVADLSNVWIDISLYQKHLPHVKVGQRVVISAGRGLPEAEGQISYVAPVVSEETRTATARVVLPNPDGVWRPGLFVTARVEVERVEVGLAVSETALQQVEGRTVVFVEEEAGFVPRPVTLGARDGRLVEIRSGLASGERFVARGGFTVKAELAREELSGGHAH